MRPEDAAFQVPRCTLKGTGTKGSPRAERRPRGRASKTSGGATLAAHAALPKPGLSGGAQTPTLKRCHSFPYRAACSPRGGASHPWALPLGRLVSPSPRCLFTVCSDWPVAQQERRDVEIPFL